MAEAKKGSDVLRYKDAWDCIRLAAPGEPEAQRDEAWIDATEKANKTETARLESELKGYKNNLIKESIRVGLIDNTRIYLQRLTLHRWDKKTSGDTSKILASSTRLQMHTAACDRMLALPSI